MLILQILLILRGLEMAKLNQPALGIFIDELGQRGRNEQQQSTDRQTGPNCAFTTRLHGTFQYFPLARI